MIKISRRALMLTTLATGAVRALPPMMGQIARKPILRLVYDKNRRAMRAIDQLR